MKETNRLSRLISAFSPTELVVLICAISASVAIPFIAKNSENNRGSSEPDPIYFERLFATERIYDIYGRRVSPFDTTFTIDYLADASKEDTQAIADILNAQLIPHHKLFDRHHYYYIEPLENPLNPSQEDIASRPRINNLKVVNDNLGSWVKVDFALYDLLELSIDFAIKTEGYFNPYVGELTDFWEPFISIDPFDDYDNDADPANNATNRLKLEKILSYVPKTVDAIRDSMSFKVEGNQYYVRLNSYNDAQVGDLSLTLGGIAKGYMVDIIEPILIERGLLDGYIFGGSSSITTLKGEYKGVPYKLGMSTIIPGDDQPAFQFYRDEKYRMSTSGTYTGFWGFDKVTHESFLRSHIINPFTGYPSNNPQQLVSLVSSDLSGAELEILSTSLIIRDIEDGINYIKSNYESHDVELVYLSKKNATYTIEMSAGFAGRGLVNNISDKYQFSYFEK